ncbi:hypothetical protein [Pseudomonas sp. CC120222-01a]|uniref:hypothetical protein n=1 Tax=Pseudomonas sp. CC120222-01a TaxID=1378075 RepID=UPI000D99D10D|nr:hypothetical protein [Pseudomonas sp. CC120222-01a]PVZ43883.1 hypothetical protein N430_00364 [Pseudomonas sp. CC120222-01a]
MKVGVFWYEDAHRYRAFQNLYEDANEQHRKFAAWFKEATALERHLRQEGHEPVRVLTTPKAFCDWCKSHGRSLDASSRTAFAHEQIEPAQRIQDLGQAVETALSNPQFLVHGPLMNKQYRK